MIVVASLGMTFALQRDTIVDWWKPAAVCFIPACLFGYMLVGVMRAITGVRNRLINIFAGVVVSFSILSGSFYILNFYKSDAESSKTCHALVVNKYSEERYMVRRVSRHRSVRGQKQMVYYIIIKLPDERTKKIEVPVREYVKMHNGQKLTLKIENGFFGIPVIKNLNLPIRKYKRF